MFSSKGLQQDDGTRSTNSDSFLATKGGQTSGSSPPSLARASSGSLPSISLPKGGGSIASMGENFNVNPADGAGSVNIPISTSPSRSGLEPSISLGYSSGNGNGPYGLGWSFSQAEITRKTATGLPLYRDEQESDVFILAGAEDLVPLYRRDETGDIVFDIETGVPIIHEEFRNGFVVRNYSPRIEGSFMRIERWTKTSPAPFQVHWRVITPDNITSIFGRDENSQIYDPCNYPKQERVFSWLLAEQYDDRGNAMIFKYKEEDSTGIDLNHSNERNRNDETRSSNRYLKIIKYGNKTPNRDFGSWDAFSAFDLPENAWMFSVVFDYGEFDSEYPNINVETAWNCRKDPFSSYRSGFEIRTYRLCQRILMFHHFPSELSLENYLVSSTNLTYDQQASLTYLKSITRVGYLHEEKGYRSKCLPPLEFRYSQFPTDAELSDVHVQEVNAVDIENLPSGIDGSACRWADLDGEGLSGVLIEQGSGWFYKRNLSANNQVLLDGSPMTIPKLGPLEEVCPKPPLSQVGGKYMFTDVQGDGLLEFMWMDMQNWGYSGRRFESNLSWGPFREFKSIPNIRMDQNTKFVDVTGDGLPDILVSEDNGLVWYPSLGEEGYGEASRAFQSLDEEKGPRFLFGDAEQTIYLADMSGDGMTDVVRLRNGEVCYWPNIGYGHFGAKVTMDNAPWFDELDRFDQQYVQIADVDGSGTNDVLYISSRGVDLYFNQAGNSFSDRKRLPNFPPVDHISSISTLDLLGNGTTCLVWSSPLSRDMKISMKYLDFTRGSKPHLLVGTTNNLGAETRIYYAPSTKFYLDDKQAGRQWITRLPFPVQCVERVETIDHISHNRFAVRYAYHHGFFDGYEREFRGFGMVDQWDTEEFDVMSQTAGANIDSSWHAPPVHTKSWFHLGGFSDGSVSQLAIEYFDVPQDLEGGLTTLLEDSVVPIGLDYSTTRESYRPLKGYLLRQEVYSEDESPKSNIPYAITESNYTVRILQTQDTHDHSIFTVVPREAVQMNFERNVEDSRVQHSMVLEVDRYGNVLKSLDIAYGRQKSPLVGLDSTTQEKLLMTYSENDFTNKVDLLNDYRLPNSFESRLYQICGLEDNKSTRLRLSQFEKNELARLPEIPYEKDADTTKHKRLLQRSRSLFRSNGLTKLLPAGVLESMAIGGESYQLALTPGLLNVFQRRLDDDSTEVLLPNTSENLEHLGGYMNLDADGNWWIPSGRSFFNTESTNSSAELAEGRRHFFLVRKRIDPFGNGALVDYDDHDLFPIRTVDALGNTGQACYDYRVLHSSLITDANKNRGCCAFDELGCVVATAVMGKEDENVGDSLGDFHLITTDELDQFFLNPKGPMAETLLGNASTYTVYDVSRFWLEPDDKRKKPNFHATISRETHASDPHSGDLKTQISFSYYDGFGRNIQSKIQAEPKDGTLTNWVADGWTVFNNKGNPVKQYEPFFDSSHEFVFDQKVGVSPTLIYDPLDRVIAMILPNHSWTKSVISNWETKDYDVNDTVLLDPRTDIDIGRFVCLLPEEDYLPTWFDARESGQMGRAEQAAAEKAAKHSDTPTVVHLDPLGRVFVSVADNGEYGKYETRVDLDIQGQVRKMFDEKGRKVAECEYDMTGSNLHTASMEAGEHWAFCDISRGEVYSWDSRMNRIRTKYDALRRPIANFLRINSEDEVMIQRNVYGESKLNPEFQNTRGQVIEISDQAGIVTEDKYDFKGNLLCTKRRLAKEYKTILDWEKGVPLEDATFTVQTAYDALNRPVETVMPDGSILSRYYNEASLLNSVTARLRGAETTTSFVGNIKYNAKGQQICVSYGNGVRTSYKHDRFTSLLIQLTTRRDPRAFPDDCTKNPKASWPGRQIQNLHYTYDAVGNITNIKDDAQQAIFYSNERIDPSTEYAYDALYRLIEASGREHLSLSKNPISPGNNFQPLEHPNDGKAMGRYLERYVYDEVGNFLSTKHHGTSPTHRGWTRNYAYNEPSLLEPMKCSNRLSQTSIGTATEHYRYDGSAGRSGNMTSMPNLAMMKWDFRNQLQATSQQVVNQGVPETTWYVYDSSGGRVRKVTERQAAEGQEPTRLKERIYSGIEIYREFSGRGDVTLERETLHVTDDQRTIALVETRTQGEELHVPQLFRYQLSNHLGSVSLELDEDAHLISYEEYTPYGSTSYQAVRSQIHSPVRYRYTGKERDEENGLDYYGARYYCSALGRWINCDPAGFSDGLNIYVYVQCNPVNWIDPDGRMMKTPVSQKKSDDYWNARNARKTQGWKVRPAFLNKELEDAKGKTQVETRFAWSHRRPLVHQPLWDALGIDTSVSANGKFMPSTLHDAIGDAGWDDDFDEFIRGTDFAKIIKNAGKGKRSEGLQKARDLVDDFLIENEDRFGILGDWKTSKNYDRKQQADRLVTYRNRNDARWALATTKAAEITAIAPKKPSTLTAHFQGVPVSSPFSFAPLQTSSSSSSSSSSGLYSYFGQSVSAAPLTSQGSSASLSSLASTTPSLDSITSMASTVSTPPTPGLGSNTTTKRKFEEKKKPTAKEKKEKEKESTEKSAKLLGAFFGKK